MINTKLKLLSLSLALIPFHSWADAYAIEARGDAMGGVGVVSANYLTAPFYNPALVAIYRRNDDAGMILPSFGITYNDPDQLVDGIDSISSLMSDIEGRNNQELVPKHLLSTESLKTGGRNAN